MQKKLYALIDIIDNKLIGDDFATVVSNYWRCNYEEFIRQTNEVVWSDYGCEKPNKKTFIKKFDAAVVKGDKALSQELYRATVKKIDQAVAKGIYKKIKARLNTEHFYKLRRNSII